jgi:hypothetical protein
VAAFAGVFAGRCSPSIFDLLITENKKPDQVNQV